MRALASTAEPLRSTTGQGSDRVSCANRTSVTVLVGEADLRRSTSEPVRRPDIESQVHHVIESWHGRGSLTIVLHAPGGFGKTTLADLISTTGSIISLFPDGVYWIGLGETIDLSSLVAKTNDLSFLLSGTRPDLQDAYLAAQNLTNTLLGKTALLVLDDAWKLEDVSMFVGGNSTVRLITTRDLRAVPEDCVVIRIPEMTTSESRSLLLSGIPANEDSTDLRPLEQLARGWPVLLKLLNAHLKEDIQDGLSLHTAADSILSAFRQRGLSAFTSEEVQYRDAVLASILDDSINRLSADIRRRYLMITAFPDSVDIPTSVLAITWNVTASEAEQICRRLYRASLIQTYIRSESGQSSVRLHDIVRAILRNRVGEELASIESEIVGSWRAQLDIGRRNWWQSLPLDQPYMWRYLGWHLTKAAQWSDYTELTKDLWFLSRQSVICGRSATEAELSRALRVNAQVKSLHSFFEDMGHILDPLEDADDREATLASWLTIPQWPESTHLAMTEHQGKSDASIEPTDLKHTGGVLRCKTADFNGEAVVSVSSDRSVALWAVPSRQRLATFLGHTDWVRACAVDPAGAWIVSGSDDATLRMWDPGSGDCIRVLRGHGGPVRACAVDPAGAWIVSGSDDATLRMWDPGSGDCIRVLRGHDRPIRDCAVAPDGRTIVSAGGDDRSVRLWDPSQGTERLNLPGHRGWVMACDIAPSGEWVVSGSVDAAIRFWNPHSGDLIGTIEGEPSMLWDCVKVPNQPLLAVGGVDGRVRLIGVGAARSSRDIGTHEATVRRVAVGPQGDILASVSDDGTAVLWDILSNKRIHTLVGHTNGIRSCAFNADGSKLVTASHDNTLRTWDVRTGALESVLQGHSSEVTDCSYLGNGKILSVSSDGTLVIWSASGEIMTRLQANESLTTCSVNPNDPQIVVVGSESHHLTAWNIETGRIISSHSAHKDWITRCTFRPDGHLIASSSDDHTLRIWDPSKSQLVCALAVNEPLYSAAWHDTEPDRLYAVGAGGVYSFSLVTMPVETRNAPRSTELVTWRSLTYFSSTARAVQARLRSRSQSPRGDPISL